MYRAEVTTKSGSLNVRSGPGTNYARIASIPKGEIVDVMTEADGWAYVSDDGVSGYVSRDYLTPVSASDEGEDNSPAQSAEAEYGEKKTILRCAENGVTIALVGEWEVI